MAELVKRKAFLGVTNIIRFNWHFYVLASLLFILMVFIARFSSIYILQQVSLIGAILILISTSLSIFVSWYIYDFTNIYQLPFIKASGESFSIANFNAGFDEFSPVIKCKFPNASLDVFDFYNPVRHTEISVKRARKSIKPYPGTRIIDTNTFVPEADKYDIVFLIFSAHEIRDTKERITFLHLLETSLKASGKIYVMEHTRDLANLLAFNLGSLHFYSDKSWKNCFMLAKLKVKRQYKLNPFINLYEVTANDPTH